MNYIILILADGFLIPDAYGAQNCVSQDGAYQIIDKNDSTKAADIGYTPSVNKTSLYGVSISNWPNLTQAEARALVDTRGASGASWSPIEALA